MKKSLFLLVCPCLLWGLQAQNLVLNPSFEEKKGCPKSPDVVLGSIDSALYWTQPYYSSDYFHSCSNAAYNSVPHNALGFQYPRTGSAYAGFCGYLYGDGMPPDYREYIEGQMLSPLEKDSFYKVEYFLNAADRESTVGCDMIGVYFSRTLIKYNIFPPELHDVLPFVPQVSTIKGHSLKDTANWVRVCGFFKASGGEKFLLIGNFNSNAETSYETIRNADLHKSYYYLDDVSVEKVPQHLSPFRLPDNTVICKADSVSTYGISPGFTQVLWSTGDTTYQTAIKGAGKQWVRAMDGGCLFTDTFDIQYVPPPRFAFPTDSLVLCSSALPLSLKTDDCCASILWSSGDTTAKTGIDEPGWVWIHENNVCGLLQDSFFLEVVAPPHLDLGPDTVLCDAAQFLQVLSAPPGLDSYSWSTGSAGPDLSITEPGAYSVEVQNACGIYRDTFVASDLSDDILRLPADTVLCQTLPLTLSAEPKFDTYAWSTGQNTQQIEAKGYGTYRVTVTNACGEQSTSVDILESNHPAVSLPPLLTVYLGDSIRLSPEVSHDKPVRYDWSPATGLSCAGCAEPFARPLVSGVFRVTVTDSLGCSDVAALSIRVLNVGRFYLPNVFSPDNDGENDSLLAYFGGEVAEVLSARTYDRWGTLVSERKGVPSSGMFEIWDGTHHGRAAAPGVYAVVVDLRLLDGSIAQVSADVTVLR